MLNYRTLEAKPKAIKDGTEFIDLLAGTYNPNNDVFSSYPLIVNKYYVGRPDLIALAVYGDDKYGDIICKVNGISNPFELNENDVIIIPSIEFVTSSVGSTTSSTLIEDEDTDEIYRNSETTFQKKVLEKRTQNEQVVGDRNYVIDKSLGLVFY